MLPAFCNKITYYFSLSIEIDTFKMHITGIK